MIDMSVATSSNSRAIRDIKSAITLYSEAIDTIQSGNDTQKIKDIVSLMDNEVYNLDLIINSIYNLNSTLDSEEEDGD